MSGLPFAPTVPAPAHPDAPQPENVVVLHPDGITIRTDTPRHWVGKRRDGIPKSETAYDLGELMELHEKLGKYLEQYR